MLDDMTVVDASRDRDETADGSAVDTLPDLFRWRCQLTPDAPAFREYDADSQGWRRYSWAQTAAKVAAYQSMLAGEDLAPGARVAILASNGVDWVAFEQAALALGLVVVGLYDPDTPDNHAFILGNSGASALFVETADHWSALASHWAAFRDVRRVFCLRRGADDPPPDELLRYVEPFPTGGPTAVQDVEPDALATILYTSGTTGRPKGVMLTHKNLVTNMRAVMAVAPARDDDRFLSILPLSHAFERVVGHYLPILGGSEVTFARSAKHVADDLIEIRPSILIGVPHLYTKAYRATQEQGALRTRILNWAASLGWQAHDDDGASKTLRIARGIGWTLVRPFIAPRVLAAFGGRLRVAVCGGAALPDPVAHFLIGLGLPLQQGYGLTEAGPVVSATRVGEFETGLAGRALPGVETSIGPDGELLVRSEAVMAGYWHNEEATSKALDDEGWLRTGDVARIVGDRIYLEGRIKEIVVMATGKKAPLADLETAICLDPLVDDAIVIGEGRPYLTALVVLNTTVWTELAGTCGMAPDDPSALTSQVMTEAVRTRLATRLKTFPRHAQLGAVCLTHEAWTVANGLIGHTLKPKRALIEKRYSVEIEGMYDGQSAAPNQPNKKISTDA
jgi:long-chain acyl-CoA synthetase